MSVEEDGAKVTGGRLAEGGDIGPRGDAQAIRLADVVSIFGHESKPSSEQPEARVRPGNTRQEYSGGLKRVV